jgi:hypothetical protein
MARPRILFQLKNLFSCVWIFPVVMTRSGPQEKKATSSAQSTVCTISTAGRSLIIILIKRGKGIAPCVTLDLIFLEDNLWP